MENKCWHEIYRLAGLLGNGPERCEEIANDPSVKVQDLRDSLARSRKKHSAGKASSKTTHSAGKAPTRSCAPAGKASSKPPVGTSIARRLKKLVEKKDSDLPIEINKRSFKFTNHYDGSNDLQDATYRMLKDRFFEAMEQEKLATYTAKKYIRQGWGKNGPVQTEYTVKINDPADVDYFVEKFWGDDDDVVSYLVEQQDE